MWDFQRVGLDALPLRMQSGLVRLVQYVYKKDKRDLPYHFTVDVSFTADSPGDAWFNIIACDNGWDMVTFPTCCDRCRELCFGSRSIAVRYLQVDKALSKADGRSRSRPHFTEAHKPRAASACTSPWRQASQPCAFRAVQRYSVNLRNHAIKLKPSDRNIDIGTSEFDAVLEEATDFVNSSEEEQKAQVVADLYAAIQKRKAKQQAACSQASKRQHRARLEAGSTGEAPNPLDNVVSTNMLAEDLLGTVSGVSATSNPKRAKLEGVKTESVQGVSGHAPTCMLSLLHLFDKCSSFCCLVCNMSTRLTYYHLQKLPVKKAQVQWPLSRMKTA